MAEKDNKWLMFKQYMHNELNITKEDIKQWVKEAVHEEAKQLVQQSGFSPADAIKQEVTKAIRSSYLNNNSISYEITQAAGKILAQNIILTLKKE